MHIEWLHLIFSHSFLVVGEIFFLSALLHMVYQRRTPTSMISWLLAIILLPHLAVPLYFILGSRKRTSSKTKSMFSLRSVTDLPLEKANPIDGVLRANGIPGGTQGNRFALYTDGTEAYSALLQEIEKAKESIFISTYVFNNDAVTAQLLKALTKRATEGVEIKILIDSLGSFPLYCFQHPFKKLRQAGAMISFFMPILQMPFRNYINLRNHRKIYLFDRRIVLTGGMNLSAEYMGPTPEPGRWNDLLFLIEGPAVFHYLEIFASDWAYACGHTTPIALDTVPLGYGDAYIQVVPSGPDIARDALFESLICAIYTAQKRIWIVTPYFVPVTSLQEALIIAHHKGVDVKLITPYESNHLLADLVRSSYMRELMEAGVEVALYKGPMLHAKAILFDDTGAMLGSVNIDNRSLLLNYEVVSFAYSVPIISEVNAWMEKLLQDSHHEMKPAGIMRRLAENLMRIVAPQL
ncbi:MAG: PLDc N-terminal domain-containing protein [Proteobacteria bacterium]|nr:PLDc N-terminal domain-containing protein [Pseudomonadota bacterium]MBU1649636.1 PLDc N-terminal domain-containing protein [Pseudomonadota bacterium]MBU1986211.1 PLDc N-terminal domain-containing protein [Pseudomonadota bacterium]